MINKTFYFNKGGYDWGGKFISSDGNIELIL